MKASRGLRTSLGMHAVILLLVVFGLPAFFQAKRDAEPVTISVEIMPIGAKTNIKPASPTPAPKIETPKEQPKPVEETKPEPPKPTPPKPETSSAELVMPKPEPVTPKEVVSPDALKEDKKVEKPKEDPKPKPQPKTEEVKKKAKEEPTLEDILKNIEKSAKRDAPKAPPAKEAAPKAAAPAQEKSTSQNNSTDYDASAPLSMSVRDSIMSQIQRCWNIPAGAKNAQDLAVVINVKFNADGSLISATLAEGHMRANSDNFFRAAADSAIRAVKQCSPLQGLPADSYSGWKELELNFDPRNALY